MGTLPAAVPSIPEKPVRRSVLLLVSLALALTLAAAPAGAAPGPAAERGKERSPIWVATYNMFREMPAKAARRDIRELAARPRLDIIGWQEMWGRDKALHRLRKHGWATWVPRGEARQDPISWRRSEFQLVETESYLAHRAKKLKRHRKDVPRKFFNRVTLRHRATGRVVSVFNNHVIPTIESQGQGKPGHPVRPRIRWAQRHWDRLEAAIAKAPGQPIVVGDFNVDAFVDLEVRHPAMMFAHLRDSLASSWQVLGGNEAVALTHPGTGRHIDYVMVGRRALRREVLVPTRQMVVEGLRSDHRPLAVKVQVRAKKRR